MAGKATHKTKDGRTVKKGLYYYMNKRKKVNFQITQVMVKLLKKTF